MPSTAALPGRQFKSLVLGRQDLFAATSRACVPGPVAASAVVSLACHDVMSVPRQ